VTYAPQKAATRANVLASSRWREDKAYTKAFASATDKRNFWEATLRTVQLTYVAELGFTSSNEFFAWVAKCDVSRDGAVAEWAAVTANKTLADEANKQRQAAAWEKALAVKATE
jgi:hypothetical protein